MLKIVILYYRRGEREREREREREKERKRREGGGGTQKNQQKKLCQTFL